MARRDAFGTQHGLPIQHSPSSWRESEFDGEMFDFGRRQCLRKGVSNHVISWTVDKLYRAVFNNIAYEVEANVDMLGSGVELMVLC